ncbi:MAG: hypothetical protein KF901_11450 [Myxococcales bacterium]|nr:hypothetical protein [Myxococcales bacterium]
MSRQLSAFLPLLTVALATGCSLFTPRSSPAEPRDDQATSTRAVVLLPELEFDDGRLHATIWYDGMQPDMDLQAVLHGPGIDVRIDVPVAGASGSCSRLSFSGMGPSLGPTRATDSPCSWPLDAPSAGQYAIELRSNGTTLDRREFSLLEVPLLGGGQAWIVDPRNRVGVTYAHPAGYLTWLRVDVSVDAREAQMIELRDGRIAGATSVTLSGPSTRGRPAIDVVPFGLSYSPGAQERLLVKLSGGSDSVDEVEAWRYAIDFAQRPRQISGMDVWRTAPGSAGEWERYFGALHVATPNAEELALARRNLQRPLRSEPRDERRACASITSTEVFALMDERRPAWDQLNVQLRRVGDIDIALRRNPSPYTAAERRNMQRTRAEASQNADELRRTIERLDGEVERVRARHEPGCLDRLFASAGRAR